MNVNWVGPRSLLMSVLAAGPLPAQLKEILEWKTDLVATLGSNHRMVTDLTATMDRFLASGSTIEGMSVGDWLDVASQLMTRAATRTQDGKDALLSAIREWHQEHGRLPSTLVEASALLSRVASSHGVSDTSQGVLKAFLVGDAKSEIRLFHKKAGEARRKRASPWRSRPTTDFSSKQTNNGNGTPPPDVSREQRLLEIADLATPNEIVLASVDKVAAAKLLASWVERQDVDLARYLTRATADGETREEALSSAQRKTAAACRRLVKKELVRLAEAALRDSSRHTFLQELSHVTSVFDVTVSSHPELRPHIATLALIAYEFLLDMSPSDTPPNVRDLFFRANEPMKTLIEEGNRIRDQEIHSSLEARELLLAVVDQQDSRAVSQETETLKGLLALRYIEPLRRFHGDAYADFVDERALLALGSLQLQQREVARLLRRPRLFEKLGLLGQTLADRDMRHRTQKILEPERIGGAALRFEVEMQRLANLRCRSQSRAR